ncbi:MAG: hypothetical protein ABSA66_00365 [Roseiarcus sp.]|jgi:hypothetical protein
MTDHQYIYLCYGKSPSVMRELRYSVETLLPEIGGDASRITIFTDQPRAFDGGEERIVDIGPRLAQMTWGRTYMFRAKPLVLAEALRLHGRACVLLDTDSFIRRGFDAEVARALAAGAAMNSFVRKDPYPFFGRYETTLPHLGRYRFDAEKALMLNSGLVAARPEHLPLLEDAVELLDRLWAAGLLRHDLEQFAIAEAFRLGGVPIRLINREFEHYCPRWSKRYMRRQLRRHRPSPAGGRGGRRPSIPFSKTRVRLFKGRWLLALAIRSLTRRKPRRPGAGGESAG